MNQNLSSFASSSVKGHQFLFLNHAVPVNQRIFRDNEEPAKRMCPLCDRAEETIPHLYLECPRSQEIRREATRRYNALRGLHIPVPSTMAELVSVPGENGLELTTAVTLNAIISWHIWRLRCRRVFDNVPVLPVDVATQAILLEMQWSLVARTRTLRERVKWWRKKASLSPEMEEQAAAQVEKIVDLLRQLDQFLLGTGPDRLIPRVARNLPPGIGEGGNGDVQLGDAAGIDATADEVETNVTRGRELPWTATAVEVAERLYQLRQANAPAQGQ
jgi:hypothetical protein